MASKPPKKRRKQTPNPSLIDEFLMSEDKLTLPANVASSGTLERLADEARAYARKAVSENTLRAYTKDWAHYERWCRRFGHPPLPPSPEMIGLYITDCATTRRRRPGMAVSSIERRLSGISWGFVQRGYHLDRRDRHIVSVLAGIRREHRRPPKQKEAVSADDIMAMVDALKKDLKGTRDRAMLLVGFAGGLRRSELVGLDRFPEDLDADDGGSGWIEFEDEGLILILRGKTGWREVEIGRGSKPDFCPVQALEAWLTISGIKNGAIFRRTSRNGKKTLDSRLSDQHVALLVKDAVRASDVRSDLPEKERIALFSGHSLRAGLATSSLADEREVQRQLGHSTVEMTRRYQRRRDRFRVNLTKAAGL